MVLGGTKIDTADIPVILADPYVRDALGLWNRYKLFGWPFSGGWAEQPAPLVRAIETIEQEMTHGGH